MTTLRIAEVAKRTGVPATTLRYYEDIGLLTPAGRGGNGYRAYDERDVQRLRFITNAKQLDLSLDDVRELVRAWDGEDCAEVQQQMAQVVGTRLVQTRERVRALTELADQLQAAITRLSEPATDGPCGPGCACSGPPPAAEVTALALTRAPARLLPMITGSSRGPGPEAPIACTLGSAHQRGRVTDWQAILVRASSRAPIPGGVALMFEPNPDVTAELARLATAEQACCPFFEFTLAIAGGGVRFEVRAPDQAQDILAAVFAAP